MSWRRWSGWEPQRSTTYTYDKRGRLVRSVTTVEPEWDDQSRGFMLALADYEAGLCPSCNHPLTQTSDPEHEDCFVPGPAIRCHRCTASDIASKAYEGSPSAGALLIPVEFRPPSPKREEVPARDHS